ncbi:Hypp114 [Branchiostoma lanceolatum]|uniref:Hypp114 protein n=1 Tax=Branchiostoma lanceolatum TaxID=7740 RepID=A0A8J9VA08_BRALA|nr:Hypp114 [Branchiostoma lanceolatum]
MTYRHPSVSRAGRRNVSGGHTKVISMGPALATGCPRNHTKMASRNAERDLQSDPKPSRMRCWGSANCGSSDMHVAGSKAVQCSFPGLYFSGIYFLRHLFSGNLFLRHQVSGNLFPTSPF